MPGILDRIRKENDIKKIEPEEYTALAGEIRSFLVENVSRTGGHLASNLGVVELTMALHLNMCFPEDKLIWDVGHQSYTHKILTGRKEKFKSLRQFGGLSGFPKTGESVCDAFNTGHSSTSISIALGIATARDIRKETYRVVAVIGDGALSGGMAFEALNNAARLNSNLIIVLNDNNMSISENVGGMANYLGKIRINSSYTDLKDKVEHTLNKLPGMGERIVKSIRRSKDSLKRLLIPGMLFEDMGLTYIGPIDGHNMEQLNMALQTAARAKEPVLVHVVTRKGKGYRLAEKNPQFFHGVDPFFVKSGELKTKKDTVCYTDVFKQKLVRMAEENDRIVAITAAMPSGTGLLEFKERFSERFFDVGIAEEHAVTFAAGLASAGMLPVVAVYSTFLQRAYDQIIHDVCLGGLPVIFAVDRAGLVGSDGSTHQGLFDLSFLSCIPGLTVMAPKNRREMEDMLDFAAGLNRPVAIRYPRGKVFEGLNEYNQPLEIGKSELIFEEKDIVLLAVGGMVRKACEVRRLLKDMGLSVSLVNVRFVKPLDLELLQSLSQSHFLFVTMEENLRSGGFGEAAAALAPRKIEFISVAVPDIYVEHGKNEQLEKMLGFTAEAIVERILACPAVTGKAGQDL